MQFFRVVEHTINCAHSREYVTATANGDADRPRLAVKQYIPLDNPNPQPGDVTIIAAHANGFSKELYEPLWDELQKRTAETGIRIRSIWIADMWNQGQSGVLNEKILGNDPSWWDHTRDLANLINQKRDEMPQPLVGMGHSMGGAQLTYLALSHPRLLHSLVLLDPVITTAHSGIGPAAASTNRRDIWDSRAAAAAKFAQSPFYRAWDPRVLDLWIRHGLRALPTELYPTAPGTSTSSSSSSSSTGSDVPVTLATTKHQELFTFLRPTYRAGRDLRDLDTSALGLGPAKHQQQPKYAFYRPEPLQAFARLPELRPSVLYVFGGTSEMSRPEERRAKMERTGSGVGGVVGWRRGG
ncbi:Alpha/beta hydrolase fold-1 [Chaetomium sp. MPI-CAGE-AT-0009]|nr:Alpha/beta hydrolase fold-1 [Chaetomium sp. MPI-CAGE-AT-0009]